MSIDAGTLKELESLSRVLYSQREKLRDIENQLKAFVEHYMLKNDFGKTSGELNAIVYLLPKFSHYKLEIIDEAVRLNELEEAAGLSVSDQSEIIDNIDADTLKAFERLEQQHEQQFQDVLNTNKQLRMVVSDYMSKNDFGKTSDELLEIIAHLPPCHYRFIMNSTYYELREAETAAMGHATVGNSNVSDKKSVLEQIRSARKEQKSTSAPKPERDTKKQGPEL